MPPPASCGWLNPTVMSLPSCVAIAAVSPALFIDPRPIKLACFSMWPPP
jgi:hypothetical protein